MKFTEFDFHQDILKGIEKAGFVDCTPVQEETFRLTFESRDVFAQSQTGTGKTAAFLLGIYQMMMSSEKPESEKALIVCPTRELAVQIEKEASLLGSFLPLKSGLFYGGVGYNQQEKDLAEGVNIMVGTPGRLIDLYKSGKLVLKDVDYIVVDEADRMFDMGFYPDLRYMLTKMKPVEERKTFLFSATLSSKVGNLTWEFMNSPGEIVIEPEQVTVDAITQELYHVGANEKLSLLLGLMKRDQPETAIIFTNTKNEAYALAKRLEINGYSCRYLMGDLPQNKRTRIVEGLKQKKIKYLVATDVAARGLHINDLSMVVNYDIPSEAENYVHRIGRTARAGKSGKAITLACEKYVYGLPAIEKFINTKIPVEWAEDTLYEEDKSEGMRFPLNDRKNGSGHDRSQKERGSGREGQKRGRPQRNRSGKDEKDEKTLYRNRKQLDPRARKIQSSVTAAVGVYTNEDEIGKEDQSHTPSVNNEKKRRPNKKRSAASPSSGKGRNRRNDKHYHKKNENIEKVNSKSSVDDRLEYYRKKYGDDFKVDANALKQKSSSKKKKKGKDNKEDASKKKGLLARLFGGKK